MKSMLTVRILSLIFVLPVFVLSVQARYEAKQDKDESNLTALVKQMAEAQGKFDTATLEKIYASDYVEISPMGEVDPRAKAIGFYKAAAPNASSSPAAPTVSTDEFNLRNYGNFAIVIARFTFAQAAAESSPRPSINFRVTLVCRKEKGEWKIASAQFTGIRPPRPQPAN